MPRNTKLNAYRVRWITAYHEHWCPLLILADEPPRAIWFYLQIYHKQWEKNYNASLTRGDYKLIYTTYTISYPIFTMSEVRHFFHVNRIPQISDSGRYPSVSSRSSEGFMDGGRRYRYHGRWWGYSIRINIVNPYRYIVHIVLAVPLKGHNDQYIKMVSPNAQVMKAVLNLLKTFYANFSYRSKSMT